MGEEIEDWNYEKLDVTYRVANIINQKIKKEMINQGFNKQSIIVTGNPHLEFLKKNPSGGVHHICYEVKDINKAKDHLLKNGARVLGSGEPQIGAHGLPVLFLHPKDFCGTLIELEEKS